ncbi:penicillin-binding transpeptidase domain-containing protein [Paenibacillus sp. 1001270B_150601_E10]|uniref:penicillin-binding transpeptidase domain-containing protein n=1 Tax=Paenibacillus sp. 1001270B_150601_E10 TaxID=2787079 RepID=UPI00189EFA90|nr:penicillin-binding transpeptidase domain-containing protein [Paenibacillus sp. 1001270B_150601_E10]
MVKRIKLRTLFIGGLFLLFFIVIISRLFWYQIWNQDFWLDLAQSTWSTEQEIPAKRGTIFDKNGEVLAMDAPAYNVVLNPKVIQTLRTNEKLAEKHIDVERLIVEKLHAVLGKPESDLYDLARKKRDNGEYHIYREVRKEGWGIDQEPYDELNDFLIDLKDKANTNDVGLYLLKDSKRFYAKNDLAAHVLGYINKENKPVGGIESQFNSLLEGKPGSIQYDKDRQGTKLPSASEVYTPAQDGKNLYLTIDSTIQQYIQEAIKGVYERYSPYSITVLAADPKTGDILGMANLPTFDPNEYWESADDLRNFYNPAIMSTYEPGSTFKIVTLAASVQEGVFDPNEYYQSGSIVAGGRRIRDHNHVGWGTISYLEGLKRSSNVAFVKLGFEKLREDQFKSYIDNFGFGEKTGIELPGENAGKIHFQYPADIAAATYGHGQLTVTPIQQIMAVSAVANGGKLMVPHIVKKVEDSQTGDVQVREPEVVREVLKPDIAKQVSEYLEQVVADQQIGTGKAAYIEGYRVAGKTGTALKVNETGEYDSTRAVVSFIGYAPVEDPRIAVLVVVDDPKDYYEGGGFVAPGIFKEIVSKSLRYMGVPTSHNSSEEGDKSDAQSVTLATTPNVQGLKPDAAKQKLAEKGIVFETVGKGNEVKRQYPEPGTKLAVGQRVYLLTQDPSQLALPNLTGKSLRDVMELASLLQWEVNAEGEGYVTEYAISTKNNTKVVYVKLKPKIP